MTLREALDRTLLLMRDDLQDHIADDNLIAALTRTTVAIVADAKNLASYSAQSAFVTLALLLARSGHKVFLSAPATQQVGPQPPLCEGELVEQLLLVGLDLLPGISFTRGMPRRPADLVIALGNTHCSGNPAKTIRISATDWSADLTSGHVDAQWPNTSWPIGGMAAAALAASEVFKISMRKLASFAKNPDLFAELYAPISRTHLNLALSNAKKISDLGQIDFVSGGAITNSALYCLLRLPNVRCAARIIEDDITALSNLNRCMLFLRSRLNGPKADELTKYATDIFSIKPIPKRYTGETAAVIAPLADTVFVGVDDIPARWEVQRAWPRRLFIGATTHFSAMSSYHTLNTSCAGCAHPTDHQIAGPIATIAFVSFWAGLWQTTYYLRHLASDRFLTRDQHVFFTPTRPETPWQGIIQRRSDCPVGCGTRIARRTG